MQRTIALIQTAFLGDTALAMLFAEQVRRAFPAEQLVFVCRPDGESLARANPAITDTLVYDKRGRDRGIHGIWHIAHALRMRNTEIIFCLQRSIRTAIVARWSGARRRIGFATADGAWLFTDRVPYRNDLHEIERNALLLSALGIEPPPLTLPIPLVLNATQQEQLERAVALCKQDATKPLVAMAPGAVWATKRWLPERYLAVARQLVQLGAVVAMIGGHADAVLCECLAQKTGTINLAGKLDPPTTVAFLRSCSLLIANDSAPTHFATLAACPTITIFGSTVPTFGFGPRAPRSVVIEPPPLPCRPCGSHGRHHCPRGTLECMHLIGADDVFEHARRMLTTTTP